MDNKLLARIKRKLNITWSDAETDERIGDIAEDALPTVCNLVGLSYDPEEDTAYEPDGAEFDFDSPSTERTLLLNYCLYEWSNKGDLFAETYWGMINSCRKRRGLVYLTLEEADAGAET